MKMKMKNAKKHYYICQLFEHVRTSNQFLIESRKEKTSYIIHNYRNCFYDDANIQVVSITIMSVLFANVSNYPCYREMFLILFRNLVALEHVLYHYLKHCQVLENR